MRFDILDWSRIGLLGLVLGVTLSLRTREASAQTTSISGVVLVDSLERPIAGAEIVIGGTERVTRSDSAGVFVLRSVPIGRRQLQIRAVGYQSLSVSLDIPAVGLDGLEILLRPNTTELEKVAVRADASPTARWLRDFESRRRMGIGRFMDSTELWAGGDPRNWAQRVAQRVPGVRLIGYGGSLAMATGNRGRNSFRGLPSGDRSDRMRGARANCYVRVMVDGVLRYDTQPDRPLFDVSNWDGPPIVAAEIYTPAQLPVEFNRLGSSSCGALVLWTKR
ncbi:carboxypeptidase-like regulatory domain-containing protein [Gemmatimonas sp.]|uniref:carboxypeptidase-like regulatory domain-containing protein n=1 Tax=Gemmatimonas sp. TaxID=1962908 RepID=UPI00286E7301|nr:carboxypeptidase-like regulatory domain-containing protein [Gemmatimonas sp.]